MISVRCTSIVRSGLAGATIALAAPLSLGCHATAGGRLTAKASANGGAEASGDVDVKVESQATATAVAKPLIKFDASSGTLEYEGRIEFDYNEAHLEGDDTFQVLETLAAFLKEHPQVTLEIEGRTDSRGKPKYNRELSKKRAAAIRDWLVKHGVGEDRIAIVGRGEDDAEEREPAECHDKLPKDPTRCEEAWASSRRAVFRVTGGGETLAEAPKPDAKPAVAQGSEPRRAWFFAAHLGGSIPVGDVTAETPYRRYVDGFVPIGVGFGGWVRPRTGLGGMFELARGIESDQHCAVAGQPSPCSLSSWRWRLEGFVELHGSTGPKPSGWFGIALGLVGLSLDLRHDALRGSQSRVGPYLAVRSGIDVFVKPRVRIGPFLEASLGQFVPSSGSFPVDPALSRGGAAHGYVGFGVRLAVDFLAKQRAL